MPMTRCARVLLIALAGLAPHAASAEERVLTLQPERTSVTFVLKATGHDVHGVLALAAGQVRFDPATGAASGEVTIDALRAQTGNRARDRDMHKNVLETARYPVITFRAHRLDGILPPSGVATVVLHGTVALHGAEHPLSLPVKVAVAADRMTAESTFEVPYLDWGLHNPSFLFLRVAPVVAVTVKTEGDVSPSPPAATGERRWGAGTRDAWGVGAR